MKNGQLDVKFVNIMIIILHAAVLFYFLGRFSGLFGQQIDKETCHNSVVLRSQQSLIGVATKNIVPLRCKTEYKCLSMGGKCPVLSENQQTINVKDELEIKQEIANSMYDCWWMFGEGNLNFLKTPWAEKSVCMFCSMIVFDDKIQAKYPEITSFQDYLAKTTISEKKMTYLQYLSKDTSAESAPAMTDSYPTTEKYAVVFGYVKEGDIANWVAGGTTCLGSVAGGVAAGFWAGSVVPVYGNVIGAGAGLLVTAAGCALGLTVVQDITDSVEHLFKDADHAMGVKLIPFSSENVKQMGCTNIESMP